MRPMRPVSQTVQALLAIPADPAMHRLPRHPEPLSNLGHRHSGFHFQHGPIPLLRHGQLHQHSAECHASSEATVGGFKGSTQRLDESMRIRRFDRGRVDEGPSDDGATTAGPTAERQGHVAAGGRPPGRLFPRGRPCRRAPRVEASGAIGLWQPGPGRLTLADREEISLGLRAGESFTAIAGGLGKAISTVSREVAANGGRDDYRAWRAHQRARAGARRPKPPAVLCQAGRPGHALAARVVVAAGDRPPVADGVPDDPMMQVSHETIYQVAVRAGPRRAASRAGSLPAHWTGQTTSPRRRRTPANSATWS